MVQQWQTVKGQSSFLKKKTYHISEHCSVNSPLIRALFKIESVRNQCLEQNWRSCRYNQWIPQPPSPPRVVNPLWIWGQIMLFLQERGRQQGRPTHCQPKCQWSVFSRRGLPAFSGPHVTEKGNVWSSKLRFYVHTYFWCSLYEIQTEFCGQRGWKRIWFEK